jgi:hypothetical protein
MSTTRHAKTVSDLIEKGEVEGAKALFDRILASGDKEEFVGVYGVDGLMLTALRFKALELFEHMRKNTWHMMSRDVAANVEVAHQHAKGCSVCGHELPNDVTCITHQRNGSFRHNKCGH